MANIFDSFVQRFARQCEEGFANASRGEWFGHEDLERVAKLLEMSKKQIAIIKTMAREEIGFIAFIRAHGLATDFDRRVGYGTLDKLEREARELVDD